MSKTSSIMIGISAIAIGLGVPGICLYANLFYGFNYVAAAIVAFIAVAVGGGIVIVGVVQGPLGRIFDDSSRIERYKLRVLRENQRATLEELDEIVDILGEIRDVLKSVEE
jgi:uncharacterized membrane protein